MQLPFLLGRESEKGIIYDLVLAKSATVTFVAIFGLLFGGFVVVLVL
jgi:hypothetical protein